MQKEVQKSCEEAALFVHGSLFVLHALGAFFNARNRDWAPTAIHAAAGIWDLGSAIGHAENVRDIKLEMEQESDGQSS